MKKAWVNHLNNYAWFKGFGVIYWGLMRRK